MHPKAIAILICLGLYVSVIAQSGTQKKGPGKTALLADLDLYRHILEKAHAGLYKYHTKKQVDSLFDHYRQQIRPGTTLLDFYRYVSTILSYIGSLHDDVSLPQSYLDSMVTRPAFFPYPVSVVNNKLLVNIDGQQIPAGAEIVSINGLPLPSILPRLYKYYTTDGLNTTGKLLGIGSSFSLFYRYEFGPVQQFHVVYKPFPSQQTASTTLPAVTYRDYQILRKKRHSLYLDTLLDNRYTFQLIDSLQAAILTVNTFSLGNATSPKHAAYKQFLQQSFATLKEKKIRHLVVDIRKNGGGSDPNDLLTYSYLTDHPFKENKQAFTLFQKVPYRQYFYTDDSTDITDIEENFLEEHNQLRQGRYYQNPDFNPFWQPDSLAFKGRIYLLIGPAVASAASLFASMVRSDEGSSLVIGEESMGGYYGHTGHNSVAYELPHTHINFSFSVVDLLQYVEKKKEIPFGSGIKPHHIVTQSQQDFISNRDAVMQFTLGLIRGKN
ncbi:peptidase S41 [Paraflavitalea soli]|uniref:Peptidase S41 n=1 Tax=Paraflavitalea soli TaxID=2315862 RepID=A0A3B7MPR1_9BACT|nr:S41 family peptidase [Paraflavitalea soli]AXY72631.1 peptidase S41 [Paraflavitalea soli]